MESDAENEPAAGTPDSGKNELLICDGPNMALEDLLPFFRDLGFHCTYTQEIAPLQPGTVEADCIVVCAELRGGPHGDEFQHILNIAKGLPVIVVAHVRSLSTAIDFFRAGASDYLPAPLDADDTRDRLLTAMQTASGPRSEASDEPIEVVGTLETLPEEVVAGFDINRLPCGLAILTPDGTPRHVNEAALSLLRLDSLADLQAVLADPSRLSPLDHHEHPLAPEAWPLYRVLRDKSRRAATVGLLRADQTRIWLRIEATPLLSQGRLQSITVTFSNITDELAEIHKLKKRIEDRQKQPRHDQP